MWETGLEKTVERAEGQFEHNGYEYDLIDLPGNYALSAHSIEEIVSRDFILIVQEYHDLF